MPLLYSVVSSGRTVLADYAICSGNFDEVVQQVLPNVSTKDHRHTYTHSDYKFHYISTNSLIFLCIADTELPQHIAFSFLEDIKDKFQTQYGLSATPAIPYSLEAEFSGILKNQMKHHNSTLHGNAGISRVNEQVDELKHIMEHSIEQLVNRGERLELLVNKTQTLSENSMTFRKTTVMVRRKQCSKNAKMIALTVVISLVLLYAIVSVACGGLAWSSCVAKHDTNSTTS